ncbi:MULTISPECIES: PKD-like domain-containing protein [unclassified Proteiniphilum]|jgi:hypothetical protein|uniref:PKD-like domain-containing protein n=1 Tax=unclassified Proteiniphilum TaxID=2622718 RepID=UPI0025806252|nr:MULTISPECIES: PKD-like domain-containing protein [unclassified Proteiniphilum]
MKRRSYFLIGVTVLIAAFTSCHDIETVVPPTIEMEKTTFTVKPNRSVLIEPKVENVDERTVYSWSLNGKIIGTEKNILFKERETGEYYLKFKTVTEHGTAQIEVKVEVTDLIPPIISLDETGDGFILETGEEYVFKPEIANKEGLKLSWEIDGEEVSTADEYAFSSQQEGNFFIILKAENDDGDDEYLIQILVVKEVPLSLSFAYPEQSASLGRAIRLIPDMSSTKNVTFKWFVNGKEDPTQTSDKYVYKPSALGKTNIKVVATKGGKKGEASIVVNTVNPEQHFRAAQPGSSPYSTKVYEFLPAPGQFVNEGYTANTMEEACQYAEGRLAQKAYVSLGGFGGYIVVGFDHSIKNRSQSNLSTTTAAGYDFAIMGNSFKGSSEPGIVWVMQDENGNGLPDDNWYELKGSETGKPGTIQDYEATYFRPAIPKSNTLWIDNLGGKGEVDWLGFHQQPFYYPNWVKENTYTLRGTRLEARTEDESGQGTYWVNKEFDWGYADNFSPIDRLTDDINYGAAANSNHFKISNAITFEGKKIHLEYIDFIKVQTGLNVKAGWLGENSTEVFKFVDIQVE